MNKKFYLLLSFCLITSISSFAQGSLDIHFNGFGFLDNREYKAFIPRSRTYSGARTALDLGLNLDSLNHFVVGVNGIHEFGAKPYFLKVDPVAYYKFESHSWLFSAGMFPRAGLIDNFPRAMLNDTLMYYRPNIEGLLARYQNAHISFTGFLDWVSRQTATDREQFIFGQSMKYTPSVNGDFYIKDYFMMLHDAGPAVSIPNDHIRDNGAAQVRLGLDLTKHTSLDSLSFEAGGMLSLERTRENDGGGFKTPKGFVASAYLGYRRFAFFDEFYAGQGHMVTYGDSYYEKKMYNRLDIIYTPFLFHNIKGQFILSLHFSPGQFNDNQEAFRITYDLGRKKLVKWNDN
ncbi:hypothetical protein [Mucilaginibacter sp. KACC 22063]|uniref:hypothetical protein n=1 Tax=Mucilaginibacter sp. KACC 22063 TaxID=3025666 RepID=UPI00236568FA|nr:hypothetical protein [Mucilaginibacter sp. KACC 22063]WDF54906.1 hypothetical protein PQ461_18415 [Mucilaginibacter sp. KACC 22063]